MASFLELLAEHSVVTRYQLDIVLEKLEANHGDLDQALFDSGVDESHIRKAKSELYGLPQQEVNSESIPFEVFKYLNEESARHYRIVPIGYASPEVLLVGIVDPSNTETQNALQFLFAKSQIAYALTVISLSDFKKVLERYGHLGQSEQQNPFGNDDQAISLDNPETLDQTLAETSKKDLASGEKIVEDAPATRAVGVIISTAIEGGASDIHIEPTETSVKVRYRVDGDLHTTTVLPKNMHSALVARIKVMAKMKLDEKRKPQDNRFYGDYRGRKVDFRVSTMPTFFGEKIVMRILDQSKGVQKISDLGFRSEHAQMVERGIRRPYGMILVTGPTGSGKSTSLYSMIQEVDREKHNVVSLEDPVEYNIPGMNQSQVQPEIGYTFASGLRSILRQDPDIIMVGEIRDKETAQLAIQAALTGHLVFSTLHTNNAIGAIPRLIDMGVDPYLLPPVLSLVIAQRLVKKLTPGMNHRKIPIDASYKQIIDNQFKDLPPEVLARLPLNDALYDADPNVSGSTGGRAAVFEMLEMTRDLEQLILKDPTEPAIYEYARSQGMLTLKEDAILKSMKGVIPWTEVEGL